MTQSKKIDIRPYAESDWDGVWCILEPVFRAGETYAVSRDIREQLCQRL